MSYYNWKREIQEEDVQDCLKDEEIFEGFLKWYQMEYDDIKEAREAVNNIIGINSIVVSSDLYKSLYDYFAQWNDSIESIVRNPVYAHNKLYFETGIGYDTIDADLLGGIGTGAKVKAFDKYIKGEIKF